MTITTVFTDEMRFASGNVSIVKRKDGRYQCRVTISYDLDEVGNRCNYKYKYIYGVDRNDVLIKRAEFIEEQIRIQNETAVTEALLTTKMHEWLYKFKRKTVKPNSFDRVECTYLHQIIPALRGCNLAGIKLKDVKLGHIHDIMDFNLDKGYSESTLKKIRDFLKEFFEYCEDEIPKNPMKKYKFYSKTIILETQQSLVPRKAAAQEKISKKKNKEVAVQESPIMITEEEKALAKMKLQSQVNQRHIRVFTDEELQRIKDTIANGYRKQYQSRSGNDVLSGHYSPKQGIFFLFLLNSGIRAGEAVALKYSDFDYKNCTVHIKETAANTKIRNADGSATGRRQRTFTSPKTDRSDAVLHLSPESMSIITQMKALEPPGYDGYVVHSNYKPIAEKTLWQRFRKLLQGAGVDPRGLHTLRHTCGTKLNEATQDLKFVAQQLRHTDPGFTARTYVHQSDKRTKEILSKIKI